MLGYEVREKGAAHSCLDDACAAMKLVLAKIKVGVDREIPLIQEHVRLNIYISSAILNSWWLVILKLISLLYFILDS